MKYCVKCGKEIADNSTFCSECGAPQGTTQNGSDSQSDAQQANAYQQPPVQGYPEQSAPVDSGSFGWAVLGFCFPLVGLILYLVWKGNKPLTAKRAGIGALVGFCLNLLFSFIGGMLG